MRLVPTSQSVTRGFLPVAVLVLSLLLTGTLPAAAQEGDPQATQNASPDTSEAVRLFLDCQTYQCDESYVRQEVTFVNYVRDRTDADIHLLVTSQQSGSGDQFTLNFIGQRRFAGMRDTLIFSTSDTDTEEEVRRGLVRVMKGGLMRYVGRTDQIQRMEISYMDAEEDQDRVTPEEDPWNYWLYEAEVEGDFEGESQQEELSLQSQLSANRTTTEWKIDLEGEAEYERESFEITEEEVVGGDTTEVTETISSTQTNYQFDALVVNSLTPHWSIGGSAEAEHSTFSNYDLALEIAPALEYNVFPYAESTTRQLRFIYRISPAYANYTDTTIFGKTQETRFEESLEAILELNQTWGSVETSLQASHYFYDLSKNRLELDTQIDIRITRGLSFNVFGNVSLIRDQLNLPAGEASQEDVLLQRRELATDYRYFMGIGLSYTFGSIYNNIVNPRLGGGGGFFF